MAKADSRSVVLSAALAINAVATFAAALVLFLAPAAIPATVGMPLERSQFFLAYLLGGCELGLSVMATMALWASKDVARIVVVSLIVMHVASGIAGVVAVGQGASSLILWNVVARVAVVALLVGGWITAGRGDEP